MSAIKCSTLVSWACVFVNLVGVCSSQQTDQSSACLKGPNTYYNCDPKLRRLLMTTPELINSDGYPVETHEVETEDGYLLTVHRIPGSPKVTTQGVKTPVLVQHGILAASDFWTSLGPDDSLAYLLADQGFDVWLGNCRGNLYSRKHTTLSPKQSKFWDFTWHEMGVYDLPAVIDYILKVTGQPKVSYVGHSMGTTMFFVLASTRPEYNDKIRFMIAAAPVVYGKGAIKRNTFFGLALPYVDILYKGYLNAAEFNIMPRQKIMGQLGYELCSDGSNTQELCRLLYSFVYGESGPLLNKTMLPEIMYRVFSGISLNTFYHYAQIYKTGRFQLFDRSGSSDKLMPEYNLTRVTCPLSIHYAYNDIWAAREGVPPLARRVKNVVKIVRLPNDHCNHNDFGFAINARSLVYDEMVQLLKSH